VEISLDQRSAIQGVVPCLPIAFCVHSYFARSTEERVVIEPKKNSSHKVTTEEDAQQVYEHFFLSFLPKVCTEKDVYCQLVPV
jgi:hypothetical protein